jgi:large subunit ribosomal protein L4
MKGGGVVFGPHPRSFAQRMPRQMRRLALRSALSKKANEKRVRVIEGFAIEEPRTRDAADLMDAIGFDDSTLIVLPAPNLVVSRSFDNLPGTKIVLARNLNLRDLFTHTYLLIAKDSLELLVETFTRPARERARKEQDHDHDHDHGEAE